MTSAPVKTSSLKAPSCGCPGHGTSTPDGTAGPSRRSLLKGLGAGAALGAAATLADQTTTARYAFAGPAYTGDTLVVLSLRGGMDGMSLVVPRGDADYYRLRPTIAVPSGQTLHIDSMWGLHPQLQPLWPFWQAGKMAAVHAVGQADPTRSHFDAMAEMERAAPGTSLRTGWLDRTLGLRPQTSAFQACQIGSTDVPASLFGPSPELAMYSVDDFDLSGSWDSASRARLVTALTALHRGVPPVIANPATSALGAVTTAAALKDAGYTPEHGAVYPSDSSLGDALKDVARLVKANVGLQVATLDYGDWGMHSDLGTLDSGRMKDHLIEMAHALAAFATDLGPHLANVTLVTLSEFGRRAEENGTAGLDHGHGNAVLLLGGGLAGGRVYGHWPGLSDAALVDGDLAGTTDYRVVLGEILQKRCGVGSLEPVFPGIGSVRTLGVARQK